jgi:hypothetical protein
MSKRVLFVLLTALLVVNVGVVFAQDDDDSGLVWVYTGEDKYGWVREFNDGRLNAFDMSAPVAIYYTTETVRPTTGPTIAVPDGIQLLAIDPVSNNGRLVLDISADEIRHMIDEHLLGTDGLIAQQNGYSLHYATPGWFWVSAPADREGKVYSFLWPDTILHPEP